jgi:Protein of unknown function (DUF2587)
VAARPLLVAVVPAEVIRIGAMASALLEATRRLPLDAAALARLEDSYLTFVRELRKLLPAEAGAFPGRDTYR